jgi:hypothetical protein
LPTCKARNDEIVRRTALAKQQHRRVRCRNLGDHPINGLHGRRRPDDVQVGIKALPQELGLFS